MHVQAKARGVRISPRKVRLVVDLVRGMSAASALEQLRFMNKAAATPVFKLIQSAVANATHNYGIDPKTLVISSITADDGPILYRFMPRAMGRATPIRKRSTHIAVILDGAEPEEGFKQKAAEPSAKKAKAAPKTASAKPVSKTVAPKATNTSPKKKSAMRRTRSGAANKTS